MLNYFVVLQYNKFFYITVSHSVYVSVAAYTICKKYGRFMWMYRHYIVDMLNVLNAGLTHLLMSLLRWSGVY